MRCQFGFVVRSGVELSPTYLEERVVWGDLSHHVALIGRDVGDVSDFGGVHAQHNFFGPSGGDGAAQQFLLTKVSVVDRLTVAGPYRGARVDRVG